MTFASHIGVLDIICHCTVNYALVLRVREKRGNHGLPLKTTG